MSASKRNVGDTLIRTVGSFCLSSDNNILCFRGNSYPCTRRFSTLGTRIACSRFPRARLGVTLLADLERCSDVLLTNRYTSIYIERAMHSLYAFTPSLIDGVAVLMSYVSPVGDTFTVAGSTICTRTLSLNTARHHATRFWSPRSAP